MQFRIFLTNWHIATNLPLAFKFLGLNKINNSNFISHYSVQVKIELYSTDQHFIAFILEKQEYFDWWCWKFVRLIANWKLISVMKWSSIMSATLFLYLGITQLFNQYWFKFFSFQKIHRSLRNLNISKVNKAKVLRDQIFMVNFTLLLFLRLK